MEDGVDGPGVVELQAGDRLEALGLSGAAGERADVGGDDQSPLELRLAHVGGDPIDPVLPPSERRSLVVVAAEARCRSALGERKDVAVLVHPFEGDIGTLDIDRVQAFIDR